MIRARSRGAWRIALVAALLWPVAVSWAGPREAILERLAALAEGHEDGSVRIVVNDGAGRSLRVGESLVYRFESETDGYLTAIHVDAQGLTTLLYPRSEIDAGRIGSDRPVRLPGAGDGFTLQVEPPVGRDVLVAIVTPGPLGRSELGVEGPPMAVSYEPEHAARLVDQIRRRLERVDVGPYRASRLIQQVDGRGEVQYTSTDIVAFFGQRTRSIAPARLDLQIQFATDSAELDPVARRNVDEFAVALESPALEAMRFRITGHTDDRGRESYNLDLSRRRAMSVRDYLVDEAGIAGERLEVEAMGEGDPMMDGTSEYARRMNRRVEFSPIR